METKQEKRYYDPEKQRRVATVLPVELARRIKVQAAERDISICDRIAEMLELADNIETGQQQKKSVA